VLLLQLPVGGSRTALQTRKAISLNLMTAPRLPISAIRRPVWVEFRKFMLSRRQNANAANPPTKFGSPVTSVRQLDRGGAKSGLGRKRKTATDPYLPMKLAI